MAVEPRNVSAPADPLGSSHVAVGRGATVVFAAGAVPLDAAGAVAGEGDAVAQAEQVIASLLTALGEGGAGAGDVAKTTVYMAGASFETQSAVWQALRSSAIGRAPSALVGVPTLGYRRQLVEIEAIAVID